MIVFKGRINKDVQFEFDIDAERSDQYLYRDDKTRILGKIIGRNSYTDYGNPIYPLFPAYLRFFKATDTHHTTVKDKKTETNSCEVQVDPELAKKALVKSFQKHLQNNLHQDSIRRALLSELKSFTDKKDGVVETEVETSQDDLINLSLSCQAVIDDFMSKIEVELNKCKFEAKLRKKIRTKHIVEFDRFLSEYTFKIELRDKIEDVKIVFEDEHSEFMRMLQGTIDIYKHKVDRIKDIRVNGLKIEDRKYEPNGQFAPYEHQWQMFGIKRVLKKWADLSQMGTGKTFSTLMWIDYLIKKGELDKGDTLVICPNSTLENWKKEIQRHTPHLNCKIIYGSYNERMMTVMEKKENRPDIYLVNFETFSMKMKLENEGIELLMGQIFGLKPWKCVVIDEAHRIKNPSAKRTQQIIDTFKDLQYAGIMSGTISANKLYDFHVPFYFLNKARNFNSVLTRRESGEMIPHGELQGDFVSQYFRRDGFNWRPLPGTIEELRSMLEECSVRFEKEECLNLPEKVYETRIVEMSEDHAKFYNLLRDKLTTDLEELSESGVKVTALNILALMTKLAEAANGWIYDDYHRLINFPFNPKLDAVEEIIEDLDDGSTKVVIWSRFTNDLHLIADKLRKTYGHDSVYVLHGEEKCRICGSAVATRFLNIIKFNDVNSELRFIVANQAAGGTGIDLTGANYEIFFSNSFVKVDRVQAQDRCHRIGMRDSLTIIDIVCKDTIDETVIDSLKNWKSMMVALLEYIGVDPAKLHIDESGQEEPAIVLNHQNQGSNPTCAIATLAMLSGKTIEDVLETVETRSGHKYNADTDGVVLMQLVSELCPPKFTAKWIEVSGKLNERLNNPDEAKMQRLDMGDVKIPMKGKGAISLVRNYSQAGHICAYADGIVYDSAMTKPMNVGLWLAKTYERGYYVNDIIVWEE